MHELGIVLHTLDSVLEVAKENHVKRVLKLTLEVGEVSGIVPRYFEECFDWAKKRDPITVDCVLNLVVLKALSYCSNCKSPFDTVTHGRICPLCGKQDTYLVTGDEINIHDIEVENEENPANPE